MQYAFVESFSGRLRDVLLNESLSPSLAVAQECRSSTSRKFSEALLVPCSNRRFEFRSNLAKRLREKLSSVGVGSPNGY